MPEPGLRVIFVSDVTGLRIKSVQTLFKTFPESDSNLLRQGTVGIWLEIEDSRQVVNFRQLLPRQFAADEAEILDDVELGKLRWVSQAKSQRILPIAFPVRSRPFTVSIINSVTGASQIPIARFASSELLPQAHL